MENARCVKKWMLFSGNKNRIYVRARKGHFSKRITAFSQRFTQHFDQDRLYVKFSSQVADYFDELDELKKQLPDLGNIYLDLSFGGYEGLGYEVKKLLGATTVTTSNSILITL